MPVKAAGKYREAMLSAERELALNPSDPDVRAQLAWLWAETGQPKKAVAAADNALTRAPSNVDVLLKCMLAYELSGRRAKALEVFDNAREKGYTIQEVFNRPEFAALRQSPGFVRPESETKHE
jgi:tetratricopeptide (TPR) repeat protein